MPLWPSLSRMMSSQPPQVVLIILAGLMRSYQSTFAALRASLIAPNAGHYRFEIIVATDLDVSCSNKDFNTGCCVEPLNESAYPWAVVTGQALLDQIHHTYGNMLVDLVSGSLSQNESSAQQEGRIRAAIGRRQLDRYAAVYVSRPDVALTREFEEPVLTEKRLRAELRRGSSQLIPQIDLKKECAERGGLSIITGSKSRGGMGNGAGLDRDWDFAYLACEPAALLPFLFQAHANQTSCRHHSCAVTAQSAHCQEAWPSCASSQPPPVPEEFLEAGCKRTACVGAASMFCTIFAQFATSRRRLGTLERAGIHAAIVRSHAPGECGPVPPLERSCAYSRPWARPERCSAATDSIARYMLAGKPGEQLTCTFFEVREGKLSGTRNPDWHSWLLRRSRGCHATAVGSADHRTARAGSGTAGGTQDLVAVSSEVGELACTTDFEVFVRTSIAVVVRTVA